MTKSTNTKCPHCLDSNLGQPTCSKCGGWKDGYDKGFKAGKETVKNQKKPLEALSGSCLPSTEVDSLFSDVNVGLPSDYTSKSTNTKDELGEIIDKYEIIDTSHLYRHEHDASELKKQISKLRAKDRQQLIRRIKEELRQARMENWDDGMNEAQDLDDAYEVAQKQFTGILETMEEE